MGRDATSKLDSAATRSASKRAAIEATARQGKLPAISMACKAA